MTSGLNLSGFEAALASASDTSWIDNYKLPAGIPAPVASPRPSQQANPLGSITGQPVTSDAPSGQPAASSGTFSKVLQGMLLPGVDTETAGNWFTHLFDQAGNMAVFGDTAADPTLERIVAIVLGLILVGAGLFMFRQTQVVIQGATDVAKRGAELAATAT